MKMKKNTTNNKISNVTNKRSSKTKSKVGFVSNSKTKKTKDCK